MYRHAHHCKTEGAHPFLNKQTSKKSTWEEAHRITASEKECANLAALKKTL